MKTDPRETSQVRVYTVSPAFCSPSTRCLGSPTFRTRDSFRALAKWMGPATGRARAVDRFPPRGEAALLGSFPCPFPSSGALLGRSTSRVARGAPDHARGQIGVYTRSAVDESLTPLRLTLLEARMGVVTSGLPALAGRLRESCTGSSPRLPQHHLCLLGNTELTSAQAQVLPVVGRRERNALGLPMVP